MELLRARVPEYGPLRDVDLEFAPGLNVVYGPNESGKTTLLDFLLGHVFRWEKRTGTRLSTILGALDRFGDATDAGGRVKVRLGDEVLSYPDASSLLHRLDLEHAGLAGLFCVRSGELELPEKEPGDFWRELKKVLSGLPHGVQTLRERAHEIADLTPTGDRSDRGDPGPRTEHAELEARIERLEALEERLPAAAEHESEIARLEERQATLEAARRARIAELHESLREARRRLAELPQVDVERVERWRELRDENDRLAEEIEKKETALDTRRSELRDREEALRTARRTAERLEARRESVEEAELEARSLRVHDRREELGDRRTLETWSYRVSGVVVVLAVGTIFFTPSDALRDLVLPLLLVLAVAGPVFYWARGRRKRREELDREEETLLDEAREAGLEVDAVSEVPRTVRSLDREASRAASDRRGAAERVEAVRERVEEEASALQASRRRAKERKEALEDLRDELDFDAPEDALAEATQRREVEESRRRLEAALSSLAGPDESRWEVDPPDADDLPAWDADAREQVDRQLERTRADYRALRDDFVAAGLSAPEDVLMELQSCRDRIRDLEATWEAGKLAGDVFATMDEALEARLADALSRDGDGSVGSVVEAVTERYRTVRRDGDGGLSVLDGSGRAFALASLSRGTRDQVYLALRLGLATSALEAAGVEGGGFFLLDDAFLTADWERRGRLVSAMETLSADGWQVIYLTCDDHLRDLFVDCGARLHEL